MAGSKIVFDESERQRVDEMLERLHAIPADGVDDLATVRVHFNGPIADAFPAIDGVELQKMVVGGVAAELTTPLNAERPGIILYLHGGAFVLGSPRPFRNQSARLALAARMPVMVIDYRLAPEHPFPAALDDVVASFCGLIDLGYAPEEIVIAGDSAGGNLALAAALRLRDAGDQLPAGLMLISPWVDLACRGASMETNADPRQFAQREGLLLDAERYLAGQDVDLPLASPINADLSDLPSVLIQVGGLETLLDDARSLAARLGEAGNDVTIEIYDGMPHEWHLLAALLPSDRPLSGAKRAIAQLAAVARSAVDVYD